MLKRSSTAFRRYLLSFLSYGVFWELLCWGEEWFSGTPCFRRCPWCCMCQWSQYGKPNYTTRRPNETQITCLGAPSHLFFGHPSLLWTPYLFPSLGKVKQWWVTWLLYCCMAPSEDSKGGFLEHPLLFWKKLCVVDWLGRADSRAGWIHSLHTGELKCKRGKWLVEKRQLLSRVFWTAFPTLEHVLLVTQRSDVNECVSSGQRTTWKVVLF